MSFKIILMVLQVVAYDNMTGSSLSPSVSDSLLTGCQLKASVSLLVLPKWHWMMKLKQG